jgi:hypothetical protein
LGLNGEGGEGEASSMTDFAHHRFLQGGTPFKVLELWLFETADGMEGLMLMLYETRDI